MAAGEPKIRLFAAVYPSEEAQRALGETMAEFEAATPNLARWVRPERVHLTVRFFGDLPRPQAATILQAMARVPAEFSRGGFKLRLARLGTFGQPSKPRVVWAGAEGDVEALGDLHGALDRELVRAGFGPDKQPYRPHMTLGRPRNARNRQAGRSLATAVWDWPALPRVEWKVDEMHLIHSVLPPETPEYISLGSVGLGPDNG